MLAKLSQTALIIGSLLLSACGVEGEVGKPHPDLGSPEVQEPTTPEPTNPEPTTPEPATPEPEEPDLVIMTNGDFENGEVSPWFGNGAEVNLSNVTSHSRSGGKSLYVSGRVDTWQGAMYSLLDSVMVGEVYAISAWVKLDSEPAADLTLSVKVVDDNGERYEALSQVSANNSDWVKLSSNYQVTTAGIAREIAFYIEGPAAGVSFLIDDVSVSNVSEDTLLEVSVESLAALADFPIGVAVAAGGASNSILTSRERQVITEQHFSQLTAENIMKPSSLQPSEGQFEFSDADSLIAYADNHSLSVHGHTLIWHTQIPSWMEQFSGDSSAWKQMLETHVTTVASHFEGKVASWDVVNEAFLEDGSYRNLAEGNQRGSIWYQNIGKEYIELAFQAARAADAYSELYYNDFNISTNDIKLDAVLSMAADFISRDIPISGVGFQMHVDKYIPTKEKLIEQFQKVVDLGLKVKITEIDLRMNPAGESLTVSSELLLQQKIRYQEIVEAYIEAVPPSLRGGISVWGIIDSDSWIIDLYGNPDWPLMFDDSFSAKPALQGFADGLAAMDAEEPIVDEPTNTTPIFQDDFSSTMNWDNEGNTGQLEARLSHNNTDGIMEIEIPWETDADTVHVKTWFGEELDFSAGRTISFSVRVPADYVNDGNMVIQAYIEDSSYTPAFT